MLFVLTLVAAVLAGLAWRVVRRLNPQAGMGVGAVCAVLVLIAFAQTLRVVPAGHVGVVDLFGRVDHATRKSGLNIVNPLARVVVMSVKTQELKEVMDVPSREGLTMQLEASVLFHLDPEQAAEVYKSVGPDYVAILLEPQFRSVTRGVLIESTPLRKITLPARLAAAIEEKLGAEQESQRMQFVLMRASRRPRSSPSPRTPRW
jgi:prohibitin 1